MPMPRRYDTNADRQKAYRQRTAQARAEERKQKGLPAAPPIPSMPGTVRWNALLEIARSSLQTALDEMQSYFDDRSETWHESERGEQFQERLDTIEQALQQLDDLT